MYPVENAAARTSSPSKSPPPALASARPPASAVTGRSVRGDQTQGRGPGWLCCSPAATGPATSDDAPPPRCAGRSRGRAEGLSRALAGTSVPSASRPLALSGRRFPRPVMGPAAGGEGLEASAGQSRPSIAVSGSRRAAEGGRAEALGGRGGAAVVSCSPSGASGASTPGWRGGRRAVEASGASSPSATAGIACITGSARQPRA
mmetsp:Transcript_2899/g.11757  ORF Transcript_2899/g.11757 Transcript_2899/m.11757 type:complete len:204 (-) Transcript_2899:1232-1843(-)